MYRSIARMFCPRSAFLKREDGTATVEAVLWMPIFMVVFALMVDTSMVFNGQSKVLRVIQDANRNMSIGRFTTEQEVEDYINAELGKFGVSPKTTKAVSGNGVVLTLVTVPASQMQAIGIFSAILDLDIDVSAGHLLDNILETDLSTMVSTI